MKNTTKRLLFIVVTCCLPLPAQAPEFDAASIKLNTSDGPVIAYGPSLRSGTLTGSMVTLRQMLMKAYEMPAPRIEGPGWIDDNRFDIVAKAPPGIADTEMKPMLQALLRDRFRVLVHTEARQMPVYDLVVAKGGVKMQLAPAPQPSPNPAYKSSHPTMIGKITTAQFAAALTNMGVGRAVLDKTGLVGSYVITLEYSAPSGQSDSLGTEFGPPDIFTALQQQLGLKLEAGKEMLDVIVIDRAERLPSEN